MKKKVLFTYDFGEDKMSQVRDLGLEVQVITENIFLEDLGKEPTAFFDQSINNIDVLVCYDPFNDLELQNLTNLKLIQLMSIGFDQVPFDQIAEQNTQVCNNKGVYSIPIAEWIMMNVLQIMKKNKQYIASQNQQRWKYESETFELYGKTIGFAGTGTIAQEAAKRLAGFGVNILGLNTSGRDIAHFDRCYSMVESDTMLSQCDIVVGLLPGTEDTQDFFNAERFSIMKDGVYFINAARGSIVDEEALLSSVQNNKIAAAALDVFKTEPLPAESPFWSLDNVYITPHSSWSSDMRDDRRFETIIENLKNFCKNQPLLNEISGGRGY